MVKFQLYQSNLDNACDAWSHFKEINDYKLIFPLEWKVVGVLQVIL